MLLGILTTGEISCTFYVHEVSKCQLTVTTNILLAVNISINPNPGSNFYRFFLLAFKQQIFVFCSSASIFNCARLLLCYNFPTLVILYEQHQTCSHNSNIGQDLSLLYHKAPYSCITIHPCMPMYHYMTMILFPFYAYLLV